MQQPNLLIVDLKSFIRDQYESQLVAALKEHININEIIKVILTFDQYTGTGNAFWHLLEEKASDLLSRVDTNLLEILLENFALDLDSHIRHKTPNKIDTSYFVFHQWLPPTSLILRNEKDKSIIYTDRESCQNEAGEYLSVRNCTNDWFRL